MLKKCFCFTSIISVILMLYLIAVSHFEKIVNGDNPSIKSSTDACFIYKQPIGRLGNHLNQYAAAYGISTWHNCTLVIKRTNILLRYFPNLLAKVKDDNHAVFRDFVKEYTERGSHVFNKHLMEFQRASKIKINGYLENWKYFKHEIANIKKQFAFSDEIRKGVLRYINQTKQINNCKTAVAIHVRLGDKTSKHSSAFGYVVAPLSYYIHAMELFRKIYSNVVFIVCSDSIDWCKTNFAFNDVIVKTGGSPIEDLAMLSLCDHAIISVGSFGWWGAFLSSGRVIAYEKQYQPNKPFAYEYFGTPYEEIFYPGWTVINDTDILIKGSLGESF